MDNTNNKKTIKDLLINVAYIAGGCVVLYLSWWAISDYSRNKGMLYDKYYKKLK